MSLFTERHGNKPERLRRRRSQQVCMAFAPVGDLHLGAGFVPLPDQSHPVRMSFLMDVQAVHWDRDGTGSAEPGSGGNRSLQENLGPSGPGYATLAEGLVMLPWKQRP